jgi:hypothetical protein
MTWEDADRRLPPVRGDDHLDLDMTWQESVRALHERISHLETHMEEIIGLLHQTKGGFRVLMTIGGLLTIVVSSWETLKSWVK